MEVSGVQNNRFRTIRHPQVVPNLLLGSNVVDGIKLGPKLPMACQNEEKKMIRRKKERTSFKLS